MLSRRPCLHSCVGPLLGRLAVALALVSYLMPLFGLPMVRPAQDKDRSQAFPCQDRPCGCLNAQQCWTRCCCFSREQKRAWMASRQVELSVATADQCGSCTADVLGQKPESGTPDKGEPVAVPSCSMEATDAEVIQQPRAEAGWTLAVMARQCRGLDVSWNGTPPALPPAGQAPWIWDMVVRGWLRPASVHFDTFSVSPPVPPPRPTFCG